MSRTTTRSQTTRWCYRLVAAAMVLLAGVFLMTNGSSLVQGLQAVSAVDGRLLLVGVGISALAVANRGLLNRAAHQAVGLQATRIDMTRTAAVGFTAHKIVKSGGAAGLAVFVHHGRRKGYSAGSVGAACALTAIASFLSLGLLLCGALVVLALSGRLTGWWIAAGVGFAVYATMVGVAVAVIIRSRVVANRWWARAQRVRRRLRWRRGLVVAADSTVVDDIFEALSAVNGNRGARGRIMLYALAGKFLGASMLLASALAVGLSVSASTVLVIYATALGSSMVSIVPGGVGMVEVSTVAMLVSHGSSAASAALAVAVFRLLDLWIPVAAGAVASRSELTGVTADGAPAPAVTEPVVGHPRLALAS